MTKESRTFLVFLILCVGLIITIKYIFSIIAPFLIGAIFACLIEPFVRRMQQTLGMRRQLAVVLLITSLVFAVLIFVTITVLLLCQEAQRLLPYVSTLASQFSTLENWILTYLLKFVPHGQEKFSDILFFREFIDRLFRSILNKGITLASLFPKAIAGIGLGGIAAYFFSRDKEDISKFCYQLLPFKWQEQMVTFKIEVIHGLAKFIRTEFILVLLTMAVTSLIFGMLGLSGALSYGLLTGILDLIPVLGPGMVYIPAVVIALLFDHYQTALVLGIGYFLLIALRQVVELKLLGKNFNLHPLITVIMIYVGMKLFGLAGVFLGPFLLIVLRGYYLAAR